MNKALFGFFESKMAAVLFDFSGLICPVILPKQQLWGSTGEISL